jgi:predicted AAA+ superfamily ATPase
MYIQRKVNLLELLDKKSFFLLGPRSVGKSTLVKHQLKGQALVIDLLEGDLFLKLSGRPQSLENFMLAAPAKKIVVIDEIQKIPSLLDEVHRLIEKTSTHFLLTGSSARKLKGNLTNLLAGRAWMSHLYPLSWSEISPFDLDRYLLYGGLPQIYLSRYPDEELKAYTRTYLYEEIKGEGLARKLPLFTRFLNTAALSHSELLNFTEIGSDSQVAPSTVREYYQVLEDTLIGFLLPPWKRSKKRKAIMTSKFYFFDTGVANALAQIKTLDRHSHLYGRAFEHFVGMELRAYLSYTRNDDPLTFWRSVNGQEVDYLIGDHTAIEVKATERASNRHLKGLLALADERVFKNKFLVTHDPMVTKTGDILCVPWHEFLRRLWDGELDQS